MKKVLIWDVPIRVFHWIFALCCVGALSIGVFFDDDSSFFPVHMLLGISACFLLIIRIALAVFGCKYNRLKALIFSPMGTLRYLAASITGNASRYYVHNPGSSAAALGMFLLVPFLLWTGLDSTEDLHEILAYALLALIVIHLAGLVIHTIRYRENISASMITGFKQGPPEYGLQSSHPILGVLLLLVTVAWISSLVDNYNATSRTVTLPILGSTIQLEANGDDHQDENKEHDDD